METKKMTEFRIWATFSGNVYGDRSYKRKIFRTREDAEKCLPEARAYYSSYKDIKNVEIQSREVSDWTELKGD